MSLINKFLPSFWITSYVDMVFPCLSSSIMVVPSKIRMSMNFVKNFIFKIIFPCLIILKVMARPRPLTRPSKNSQKDDQSSWSWLAYPIKPYLVGLLHKYSQSYRCHSILPCLWCWSYIAHRGWDTFLESFFVQLDQWWRLQSLALAWAWIVGWKMINYIQSSQSISVAYVSKL